MRYVHKFYPSITIEIIEPTNKGYKVFQYEKGKKKIAFFSKQEVKGDQSIFQEIN